MKIIVLSGGSGKRLWPLSNDSRSKQFLKILRNPKNELQSMAQRMWTQLKSVKLADLCFIAASRAQVDIIQNQLGPNIPLITEPSRRDTFPAIALACSYLYSKVKVDLEEVICVIPVDQFVEEEFFHRIKELESIINETGTDLALLGVRPTQPDERFGYIIPKNQGRAEVNYLHVDRFIEKPNLKLAEELIEQNALWNCGVFAFKLKHMISVISNEKWPLEYHKMIDIFEKLPKTSFDYKVVEKTGSLIVVPYTGKWKDLGTWNSLTEQLDTNVLGKGFISQDSKNTHLINELNLPITILGLSNVVVAASPDGILVSEKQASPRIKQFTENNNERPMYEERRWGWYKVLDYTSYEKEDSVLTKKIRIHSGKNLSYQTHKKRSEVWTIISGVGEFALDGDIIQIKAGDVLKIPMGAKHAIKAITDVELIEVQRGSELIEEDIDRLLLSWEEIEKHCRRV